MNKLIYMITALLMCLCFSTNVFAYSSNAGSDPENGQHDREYRSVVKSVNAGSSKAIVRGDILTYEDDDGFTVTVAGENTSLGSSKLACVAEKAVATGDTAMFRCVNRGFIDFLRFDASSTAILSAQKLCSDSNGTAFVCAACTVDVPGSTNNCRFGDATQNSGIIAREAKSSGSGLGPTGMKVMLNLR